MKGGIQSPIWLGGFAFWWLAVTGGEAQTVIRAKDYSGFLRGDGYAWRTSTPPPIYSPPPPPGVGIEWGPGGCTIRWSGEGVLQCDADLAEDWTDLPSAVSPHLAPLKGTRMFYRIRQRQGIHAGVGTGCPQQGFDVTYLPDGHWANTPATVETCGWIVQEKFTGFVDVTDAGLPYVRVVLRSFDVDSVGYDWWTGSYDTWQDDAIHQNDGWFHFRVRNPGPGGIGVGHTLRFQIAFDNPYAFGVGSPERNEWWRNGFVWDWEDHSGRHIYTPIYRIHYRSGEVGAWQHVPESGVTPDGIHMTDGRSYRCMFQVGIPPAPTSELQWREIEVAQNLPYTLEDRAELWREVASTYPFLYDNLGLRKKRLCDGGLSGATPYPGDEAEFHELYAIEVFRTVAGSSGEPDLPNNRIAIIFAGMDYEPAGNWVADGMLREILDNWATFSAAGSYVVIPIANPDGYEWPSTHVIPYGNGYGTTGSTIQRGYMFTESETEVPYSALDPETQALRDYVNQLDTDGLDGNGGQIVGLLDLENDLCPSPLRWPSSGPYVQLPPIYGYIHGLGTAEENLGLALIDRLRDPAHSDYTHKYVQTRAVEEGWRLPGSGFCEHGIPLVMIFEFDAAALYSESDLLPTWMVGGFTTPIQVDGMGGGPGPFHVHGYIDQVGQEKAGDPAWVFKQFGRDIANAMRVVLMP